MPQILKIGAKPLDKPRQSCYYGRMATRKKATDFVTVRQAAKKIGVHFTTIYRWIDAGRILSINFGGIVFIPMSEVERLNDQTAGSQPTA